MFESAVALYEPINTYKPIGEGIGIADGPLVFMSYPGFSFLKIPFPTRMTIVRLASGELWLHSPTAFDAGLADMLSAMGPIRHLVSPNKLHYAHLGAWSQAFHEATVWASPGVRERARSQGIEVRFDRELGPETAEAWRSDLLQTAIPGSYLDELVFFHRASKTLILTDTIQNFELARIKQPYRFLVWLSGAYAPRGQLPIDLRATFWPKRRAVRQAVREMLAWGPERIIVSHGRCIEQDAAAALRYAFRWAL
ncbi:MAG: DUF4336 domain-containing protein [Rhodomicrobium sp.]